MQKRIAYVIAGAAVLSGAPLAYTQLAAWRVVAGESGSAVLPAGGHRTITDITLGDVGADLVGLRIANRDTMNGYRTRQHSALVRRAQSGVNGHPGPGRDGTENTPVFANVDRGWRSALPQGQRVFAVQAGPAELPVAATDGIWR